MDWSKSGLDTLLPVAEWQSMGVRGRNTAAQGYEAPAVATGATGPAFLAFPNFMCSLNGTKALSM